MTPVINPWVFYAISVADGVKCLLTIGVVLSIIIGAALLIMMFIEYDWEREYTEICKRHMKNFKCFVVVFIICAILSILIPDSNTITKMIVAQNVTYERVEGAADTVQEVYEDFMELLEEESER